jgi:nucleoside-diphosphate-sugar epimerase
VAVQRPQPKSDMRVLVTGASGFVGKRLCEELTARGIPFIGTSRAGGNGLRGVGELAAGTEWSSVLDGVTAVVHLAARVHVMSETEIDPVEAFRRVNVDGTVNLARQAVKAGVRRFVFVSSVKVNGEATTSAPFSVNDTPVPQDPYGVSKHEAEIALWKLARETGLEVVVVRPPLVYGPGVKANFRNLMRAISRGIPLPVGSVSNRRSMIALDNLVDFLVAAVSHDNAAGHTFLVSDGEDISTAMLVRKLAAAMHRSPRLIPVPIAVLRAIGAVTGKSGAIDRLTGSLQIDDSPCRQLLGWTPPVSVDRGIDATVAHFLSDESTNR